MPFSKMVAMRRFHESLFPEDEVQQLRTEALQRLSAAEVYELRYCDLQQAVDRLERLVRSPGASLRASTALASGVLDAIARRWGPAPAIGVLLPGTTRYSRHMNTMATIWSAGFLEPRSRPNAGFLHFKDVRGQVSCQDTLT